MCQARDFLRASVQTVRRGWVLDVPSAYGRGSDWHAHPFDRAWQNGSLQEVGLHLHQEPVGRGPAIGAQRGQRLADIGLHRLLDIGDLVADRPPETAG